MNNLKHKLTHSFVVTKECMPTLMNWLTYFDNSKPSIGDRVYYAYFVNDISVPYEFELIKLNQSHLKYFDECDVEYWMGSESMFPYITYRDMEVREFFAKEKEKYAYINEMVNSVDIEYDQLVKLYNYAYRVGFHDYAIKYDKKNYNFDIDKNGNFTFKGEIIYGNGEIKIEPIIPVEKINISFKI